MYEFIHKVRCGVHRPVIGPRNTINVSRDTRIGIGICGVGDDKKGPDRGRVGNIRLNCR